MRLLTYAGSACALIVLAGTASADTIDFNSYTHGEIIAGGNQPAGVTISALNPNRPFDIAAVFDTGVPSSHDGDLNGPPWSGGNLPSDTELGGILFLAENNDGDGDGVLDDPDDEASRPVAGDLIFDFAARQISLSFDLIDIESGTTENGSVEFFANGVSLLELSFSSFAEASYGNNSINRIDTIGQDEIGGLFDRVVFHLAGSGAIDNVVYIPAPSAAALLGLAGLTIARRRRA